MALRGHYRGRLYHLEVDLVEALPLPVSERRMRELARLLFVEEEMLVLAGLSCLPHRPL